jgi:hypothetical protein
MLDRFDGSCEHEPEYQTNGHCVRWAMVTSLDELRRSMGAPAYRGSEGRLASCRTSISLDLRHAHAHYPTSSNSIGTTEFMSGRTPFLYPLTPTGVAWH